MSNVTVISESQWQDEVLNASTPVLVDFFATWCPPCKMLGQILDGMVEDYAGKVKIVKLNAEEAPQLSRQFGIRAVPTMVFMNHGQVVEVVPGLLPPHELAAKLDELAAVEA